MRRVGDEIAYKYRHLLVHRRSDHAILIACWKAKRLHSPSAMGGAVRVALLESEVEQLRRRDAQRTAELAARERRIRLLEEALRLLQADRDGASREKLIVAPGQREISTPKAKTGEDFDALLPFGAALAGSVP
jgi:hypothetical protein